MMSTILTYIIILTMLLVPVKVSRLFENVSLNKHYKAMCCPYLSTCIRDEPL